MNPLAAFDLTDAKTAALLALVYDRLQQIEAWCAYPSEHLTDANAPRFALQQIKDHAAQALGTIERAEIAKRVSGLPTEIQP